MPEVYADVAETVWYTGDSSPPLVIFKPPAFDVGQMLIVVHMTDASSATMTPVPTGWTQEENPVTDVAWKGRVYSHIYDGTEPSTWDFVYGSDGATAAALFRITHADVTSPVVLVPVATFSASNSATMDAPTVTPSSNHDLLISLISSNGNNHAFSSVDPTGMTDLGQAQLLNLWAGLAAAKELLVSPGATGVRTWTSISPTAQHAAAITIAVKDEGFFDPDPPRIPPLPTISESLLNQLLAAKMRPFVGGSGTAWVRESLVGGASNATVTLVTNNGTRAGDVLYCFHGSNFYTAAGLTTPTGTSGTWTLEATGDNGSSSAHLKLWRRVVTVDGPQTVTVAPAVDEEIMQHLIVVSGADTTSPTDVAAGGNGAASTAHVAPTITPTSPYPLLLCAVEGAGASATYTKPPGMDQLTNSSGAGFGGGSVARQVLGVTNAATGTRTFTSTVSQVFASVSVAIRAGSGTIVAGGGGTVTAADTATAVDAVTASVVLARTAADTAAATDVATRAATFARAGADAAAASDSVTRSLGTPRAVSDTAAATDVVTRTTTRSRTAADTAAATDAASRTLVLARATSETAAATDVAAGSLVSGGQSRTASDTAAATDAATRTLVLARTAPDTASATDAATRGSARTRATSDVAAATDATLRTLAAARASADTAAATDTATRALVLARTGSDTAAATDAVTRTGAWARTAPGTAAATDVAARSLAVSRPAADTAAATDAATRATARTRAVSDTAAASDTATGVLGGGQSRTAADTAAATDVVTRAAQAFSRTAPSTAAATDGAGRVVARFRTTSETAVATDVVTKSLVRTRTATDTAAASDVATRAAQAFTRAAADTALAVDAAVGVQTGGITYRPNTGTTARPNTGTTSRPGSGTTARPGSGTTVRPYTGTTARP